MMKQLAAASLSSVSVKMTAALMPRPKRGGQQAHKASCQTPNETAATLSFTHTSLLDVVFYH